MDFDIFENHDEISVAISRKYNTNPSFSAKEALKHIDQAWYTLTSKRARWMDLLGDYAGTEPFVIDGMFRATRSPCLILIPIYL